ncbi:hypothetical protein GLYMA_03G008450v4 [Glycine max]|nr:hypothetical protein GLYMA_03G008450v4 [Glycine max]KAH1068063.1 hypothetical protein GYH30_005876 [Glycine max]
MLFSFFFLTFQFATAKRILIPSFKSPFFSLPSTIVRSD